MNPKTIEKWMFLFMMFSVLLFFTSCRSTGGGVSVDWGNDTEYYHTHDVKRNGGGPPSHAPAHGYRAKHHYQYYPSTGVYYDSYRKVYFYLEGDHWRMSVSLPQSIHVQLGNYVDIEMDSDKPYTHYEDHKRKYPPGQLKKNGKKKYMRS